MALGDLSVSEFRRTEYVWLSLFLLFIYLGSAFLQRNSLCCKLYKRVHPPPGSLQISSSTCDSWVSLILGYSMRKPSVATELKLILQTSPFFWLLSVWFLCLFLNLIRTYTEKKRVIFTDSLKSQHSLFIEQLLYTRFSKHIVSLDPPFGSLALLSPFYRRIEVRDIQWVSVRDRAEI